jgi:hypothetical protein
MIKLKKHFQNNSMGMHCILHKLITLFRTFPGKQEVLTANPKDEALCIWYDAVTPNGSHAILPVDTSLISGLSSGSKVSEKNQMYISLSNLSSF